MRLQEPSEIGTGDAPSLADMDGAQLTGLDPQPHGRLGDFKPFGKLLNGLIPVFRHPIYSST